MLLLSHLFREVVVLSQDGFQHIFFGTAWTGRTDRTGRTGRFEGSIRMEGEAWKHRQKRRFCAVEATHHPHLYPGSHSPCRGSFQCFWRRRFLFLPWPSKHPLHRPQAWVNSWNNQPQVLLQTSGQFSSKPLTPKLQRQHVFWQSLCCHLCLLLHLSHLISKLNLILQKTNKKCLHTMQMLLDFRVRFVLVRWFSFDSALIRLHSSSILNSRSSCRW